MSTAFTDAVRALLIAEENLVDKYADLVARAPTVSQQACLLRAEQMQRAQIRALRWVLGEIPGTCPVRRLRARLRYRVTLLDSPSPTGRVIMELPAGTEVEMIREVDGWVLVRLSDGTEGYVRVESLEADWD